MMKFQIQGMDGIPKDAFGYELMTAIKYNNWFRNRNDMGFTIDQILHDDHVPVGTVEFVHHFMKRTGLIPPNPINVPQQLMHKVFTCRDMTIGSEYSITERCFAKSMTGFKKFADIVDPNFDKIFPDMYQISDIVPIDSEWRAFVYQGKLVGLHNYSGDFTVFPDVRKIKGMIAEWTEQPIACTIDVGVFGNDTFVIECHDFYSCGLYGFADYALLPVMFSRWWYNFKTDPKNQEPINGTD